jgi:hypothetical protein
MGEYDAKKLLLIGYLYCSYSDAKTHINDMWLLLNPKLLHTVPKDLVADSLTDLFYIAADSRSEAYWQSVPQEKREKEEDVRNHLTDCKNKKAEVLGKLIDSLPEQIDRNKFDAFFTEDYLRTFTIRRLITGKSAIVLAKPGPAVAEEVKAKEEAPAPAGPGPVGPAPVEEKKAVEEKKQEAA